MKKIKILIIVPAVVVLAVVTAAVVSCNGTRGSREVIVKKGPFHMRVHAVGQLKAAESVFIGPPPLRDFWNYTITFMAPEGKSVKAGEMILGFDAKELMERLALKQSELETAKKELEKIRLVEQELKETLTLELAEARVQEKKAQRKNVGPEELQAANDLKKNRMDLELAGMRVRLADSRVENQTEKMRTQLHTQASKIKELESQVMELQQDIEQLNVKAPKDGIMAYKLDWRGRKKTVGTRCWFGDEVMEMPDLNRMQVAAVIPEPESAKIKEGLPVEIRLDSNPDRVFKGKVKSMGRIFRTKSYDQPAIVVDAVIDILDPDPELMRPGMAAGIDIIIASKPQTLQLPETAIIYREEGLFVLKKSFMGKKQVAVTLGARSAGQAEIVAGLKENDRVIIPRDENGENQ